MNRQKAITLGSIGLLTMLSPVAMFWSSLIDLDQEDARQTISKDLEPKGAGYFYSAKRVNLNKTVYPQAKITQAVQQKRDFFSHNTSAMNWQELGPNFVGGRTRAIAFSPSNPDVMYSAGVSGGVFKSEDAGQNWRPVFDDMENLAVVSMVVLPGSPEVIFAGTGEGHYVGRPVTRSRGVEGNGIFISQDAGENWQALPATLDNPDFRFVNRMAVGEGNTLFAATETGIWRSSDLGNSWQRLLDQSNRVGGCLELSIKPNEKNVILASCGNFQASVVYRSNDSGETWHEVLSAPDMGRTITAFAPSEPSVVYAVAAQNATGQTPYALQGFYRSENGGIDWTPMVDVENPNILNRTLLSNPDAAIECANNQFVPEQFYGQGWYDTLLEIDPTNADRVWVGAVDLFRTDDGGMSFGRASIAYGTPTDPAQYIHPDHHLVVYHPNFDGVNETRLYNANDGGLYISNNPNDNVALSLCDNEPLAVRWQTLNNNYAVNQFYHGSVSKDGKLVMGGTQDNGTWAKREDEQWEFVGGGDGTYSAIDPDDNNVIYTSSQFAQLVRTNLATGESHYASTGLEFGAFITPWLLNEENGSQLFLAATALWRSDNRGDNWTQLSTSNYSNVTLDWLSSLDVKPGNANKVLMGSTDGYIYTHEAALTANSSYQMAKQKISDGFVSSVQFVKHSPNKVYATVSTFGESHIHFSDDEGETWQVIDGTGENRFPDIPAHDLIRAPEDENTLYVASDLGVYISRDHGEAWVPLAPGLPNTPVETLVLIRHELQSSLYAFTYGRGAFKLDLTDVENIAPEQTEAEFAINAEANSSFSLNLSDGFIDRNLDQLTFGADELPENLEISVEGLLQGSYSEAGTYDVTIFATDSELKTESVVSIVITEPSPPPPPLGNDVRPNESSGGGSLFWLLSVSILGFIRKVRS